jgi:hypothetical protein
MSAEVLTYDVVPVENAGRKAEIIRLTTLAGEGLAAAFLGSGASLIRPTLGSFIVVSALTITDAAIKRIEDLESVERETPNTTINEVVSGNSRAREEFSVFEAESAKRRSLWKRLHR